MAAWRRATTLRPRLQMDRSLGFTVRMAASTDDLLDACTVRAAAYGRHVPPMRSTLAVPDAVDTQGSSAVILCRDKVSAMAVGTLRLQRANSGSLQLEQSVDLPERFRSRTRAELTRLAVLPGADARVRLMLMKASYLWCLASQVRWMVIGARSAALIRIYRRLGFEDVFAADTLVPLAHAGNLPHRILAFDVTAAERTCLAARHGLYSFMVDTFHEDLQLFEVCIEAQPEFARAA